MHIFNSLNVTIKRWNLVTSSLRYFWVDKGRIGWIPRNLSPFLLLC